ncbi:YceI family protein [Spirosoma linguale]|uniref:YceI family protein n=1 Tax=Spirosoma linguale (strain ATCC 33905 / DSM 74 / LMG 10896 / Claus 1) TaxID=504472 RepID=D2QGP1_SPILD|nr:YceI family protein [Spirosoma linguale DSM 74]
MKKHFILLIFGLFMSLSVSAQPAWKTTKADVTFKIRNAGLSVDGSFGGFMGTLLFDPAMPEKAQLSASVDAATIETGIGLRNNHLKKPDYFDVANHPRISLKSTHVEKKGVNAYLGTFSLTLKGTTRTVMIPFTVTQTGNMAQFAGEFTINRRDYDVGGRNLLMSNDVTIMLSIQAQATVPVAATN